MWDRGCVWSWLKFTLVSLFILLYTQKIGSSFYAFNLHFAVWESKYLQSWKVSNMIVPSFSSWLMFTISSIVWSINVHCILWSFLSFHCRDIWAERERLEAYYMKVEESWFTFGMLWHTLTHCIPSACHYYPPYIDERIATLSGYTLHSFYMINEIR